MLMETCQGNFAGSLADFWQYVRENKIFEVRVSLPCLMGGGNSLRNFVDVLAEHDFHDALFFCSNRGDWTFIETRDFFSFGCTVYCKDDETATFIRLLFT
jgi:hypothetical protein